MRSILDFLLSIVRYHKAKLALFISLTLMFTVLLFPYGDLTSWMTSEVSKLTQQQVYVTSSDLGLSLLPHPGVKLKDVYIEATQFPALRAEAITFRPVPWGFPAGVIQATGIGGGDATIKFKTKAGGTPEQVNELEVNLDGVSLAQVTELLPAGAPEAKGSVQAMMDVAIPQNAPQNLSGDVNLAIQNFSLPTFSASTPMGPLELPSLNLSTLQSSVQIENGVIQLEEVNIGQPGDSVAGKVSGRVTLGASGRGRPMVVSSYDLNLDLTFSSSFMGQPSVSLFTGLIDAFGDIGSRYKHPMAEGVRYAFRITASSPGSMPRILPPGN